MLLSIAFVVAQVGIPPQRGPMISAAGPVRGVTVSASAEERIPATSAVVTLNFTSTDRALTIDADRLAPVVDALVKAGADPSSVHLPANLAAGPSNLAFVTATIDRPTAASMERGIMSVGARIASLKDLVLRGAQVRLIAQPCAPAIERVRREAIAGARAKAGDIARDLSVSLGGAIAVNEYDQLSAQGSCEWQYAVQGFGNPFGPQTPSDYVSLPVTANVTITYAIK